MKMVSNKISKPFIAFIFISAILYRCDTENDNKIYHDITGAYTCEETSPYTGLHKYIIEIDRVKDKNHLLIITNFNNQGDSEFIYATFAGDSLSIDSQIITGLFINGSGNVNPEFNRIELNYTVNDGNEVKPFTAVYSR